ncbi:chromosome condensation complex protein [Laccaria bicolor S238N-H82]|uniref:Chromosome condensation complex protein n=1 Tax=Laccaria bicolor (strain S238N-H82 / ATCC MYA-4686) TaxID=486041 RepID=B0DNS1_LACBS|nr:chromosome condensation complex protein [Laccaria bicolor S238N-H82]EDR03702.1 chromosome condensation complex protein [Laccaria bicolor S238N-H82]|eukprot:XP_001885555.1 chromosome condensation complex protein [Laccaria bicolor S238N-H82]
MSKIFDQVGVSIANHGKNFVALYKTHINAAQRTEKVHNGRNVKLVGEKCFERLFADSLFRALPQKKGISEADRVIKFTGGYIRFVNEKAAEEKAEADPDEDPDDDTTASRFTAFLLRSLLPGFEAKDKNARYRTLQTVAEMVSHLGEIDEDLYEELRAALLDRMERDREAAIRLQATISVAKLCGAEDPTVVEAGESGSKKLQLTLVHDPAPEVRRAALLNLPINEKTLPLILDRTRDTDDTNRKLVYNAVLEANVTQGPTDPRALTIAQRELIVKNGLGDRVPAVRAAAASLIARWVETENSGVLALLKLFDLANGGVAADALLSIFTTNETIFDNLVFGDNYWVNLTPESAFLARVFVDHCKATKDEVRLEAALPVVTALAFRIQDAYNKLLEGNDIDAEERLLGSIKRNDKEFVISELLKLAVNLDYTDEIGRRKMFKLVRDMLSKEALPQSLVASSLDVLRELTANERDLIRVVVEIIQELREDDEDGEEPAPDADAETNFGDTPATVKPPRLSLFQRPREELSDAQRKRTDHIDLKCLSMCAAMLERVNSTFEENLTLEGILGELILPSVRRDDVPLFKEKAVLCLGLCCLISTKIILSSIDYFMKNIPKEEGNIKIVLIQSLFDLLMTHDAALSRTQGGSESRDKATQFLIELLDDDTNEKVLALLCTGIAKLVLNGMITDQNAVRKLVEMYVSPKTASNQELRQHLTFSLPVYSYSSPQNQLTIVRIFIPVLLNASEVRKKLDEDTEMVSSSQLSLMFLDWTDPFKLANRPNQACYGKIDSELNSSTDMLILIFFKEEDKKVLCQMLTKLHIPDKIDDDEIKRFKVLISNLRERHPVRDATSKTAFNKFEGMIAKKFEKQLEGFDSEEYRKLESLQELFAFLDDIIPDDDDDEVIDIDLKRKGRKR